MNINYDKTTNAIEENAAHINKNTNIFNPLYIVVSKMLFTYAISQNEINKYVIQHAKIIENNMIFNSLMVNDYLEQPHTYRPTKNMKSIIWNILNPLIYYYKRIITHSDIDVNDKFGEILWV